MSCCGFFTPDFGSSVVDLVGKVVLVLVVVGASVVVVVVGMVVEVALVLAVVVLVLTPGARTIAGGGRGIKLVMKLVFLLVPGARTMAGGGRGILLVPLGNLRMGLIVVEPGLGSGLVTRLALVVVGAAMLVVAGLELVVLLLDCSNCALYGTGPVWQMTPAASDSWQSFTPHPSNRQSVKLASPPAQYTLSIQNACLAGPYNELCVSRTAPMNPSSRHTTEASRLSHSSSQTEPHFP